MVNHNSVTCCSAEGNPDSWPSTCSGAMAKICVTYRRSTARGDCAPSQLQVERLSHDCILAEETFRSLNGPVKVNGQRASGLRFADPKVQALWHVLVLFRVQAYQFPHPDLRRYWAALTGRNESDVSQGAIAYQLRRLRLHGLIQRLPHTPLSGYTDGPACGPVLHALLHPAFASKACLRLARPPSHYNAPEVRVRQSRNRGAGLYSICHLSCLKLDSNTSSSERQA
jgi:hypothetical protein